MNGLNELILSVKNAPDCKDYINSIDLSDCILVYDLASPDDGGVQDPLWQEAFRGIRHKRRLYADNCIE